MARADFAYYKAHWSGLVPEEKFGFLSVQAVQTMNYQTNGSLPDEADWTDEMRYCQCELVDYLFMPAQAMTQFIEGGAGMVQQERVGNWTRRYTTDAEQNVGAMLNRREQQAMRICQRWLTQPTNYMYSGD